MKPLAIDLYCGLGGWTEGLLAEGYDVVGFDNERHVYGEARYPAQLVLQDVLTIHGRQFKDAALIVASPPCQAYSYRAMPWKLAKALQPPDNSLFEACFRIQREAIEAAGHFIPLVVENVCGAQKWVGRARWHYGSFYLWGNVPALMPMVRRHALSNGIKTPSREQWHGTSAWTTGHLEKATKNDGGSWFNIGSLGQNVTNKNPVHALAGQNPDGRKQPGLAGLRKNGKGDGWFQDGAARHGSKSSARKHASAQIAKIPLPLSSYIARAWYPVGAAVSLA